VALHPLDKPLWKLGGGAPWFGLQVEPGPEPSIALVHGQELVIGDNQFEVRHVPGHTPGHVIFYCAAQALAFVGDVIFQGGIGRTDFPGGSFQQLMQSLKQQVLTLPAETRLLSGHGPETSVGTERETNPFLAE
jgi:hydroxyacylglutathione hydrolase